MGTSEAFLVLSPPVIAAGLLKYRHDYRRSGRTTAPGVLLLLAAWLMPMCVLGYAGPLFPEPTGARAYAGYGLMVLGLALSLVPLWRFTTAMVVGRDTHRLITTGVYGRSRNPQYLAFLPFVAGYALVLNTPMAWVGVALYLGLVHFTVRVEEEHLERAFGDEYRRYAVRTPRYLPH